MWCAPAKASICWVLLCVLLGLCSAGDEILYNDTAVEVSSAATLVAAVLGWSGDAPLTMHSSGYVSLKGMDAYVGMMPSKPISFKRARIVMLGDGAGTSVLSAAGLSGFSDYVQIDPDYTSIQASNMTLQDLCFMKLYTASTPLAKDLFFFGSAMVPLSAMFDQRLNGGIDPVADPGRQVTAMMRTQGVVFSTTLQEIYAGMYMLIMLDKPVAQFAGYADVFLSSVPNTNAQVRAINKTDVEFDQLVLPHAIHANFTLQSLNDPYNVSRIRNGAERPRICNGIKGDGRELTPQQMAPNRTLAPLWMADSDSDVHDALTEVSSRSYDHPCFVMLLENVSLDASSGPYNFSCNLIFIGPLISDPSRAKNVSLDFRQISVTKFLMARKIPKDLTNRMYMSKLTVRGLASATVGSSQVSTALGFGAVGNVTRSITKLSLTEVTLMLPQSDYMALLAAVLRQNAVDSSTPANSPTPAAPVWKQGANATRDVLAGVLDLKLDELAQQPGGKIDAGSPWFILRRYSGYGVAAEYLTLMPETPLPPCQPLPDWPLLAAGCYALPGSPGDMNARSKGSPKVAVGVGVGVGGALLLAACVVVLLLWVRGSANPSNGGRVETGTSSGSKLSRGTASSRWSGWSKLWSNRWSSCGSKHWNKAALHSFSSARPNARSASQGGTPSTENSFSAAAARETVKADLVAIQVKDGEDASPRDYMLLNASNTNTGPGTAGHAEGTGLLDSKIYSFLHEKEAGPFMHERTVSRDRLASDKESSRFGSHSGRPHSGAFHDLIKNASSEMGGASGESEKVTLLSVLGKGASGCVYKGHWRGLPVAVKTVVFSARSVQADMYKNAVTEAAVCMSVSHPNVVTTYKYDIKEVRAQHSPGQLLDVTESSCSSDGSRSHVTPDYKLFLIQEYCHGNLDALYQNGYLHEPGNNRPEIQILTHLLKDIACGLEYLHAKNLVHGDIKPPNVLLLASDKSPYGAIAKVADFGLAAALNPAATHVSNFRAGTPFYIAPEVVEKHQATPASDIYSFGVMMWQLFFRQTPWQLVNGMYSYHPDFPTYPAALEAHPYIQLMVKCLSHVPPQRPSSGQVVAALEELLQLIQSLPDMLAASKLKQQKQQGSMQAEGAAASSAAASSTTAAQTANTHRQAGSTLGAPSTTGSVEVIYATTSATAAGGAVGDAVKEATASAAARHEVSGKTLATNGSTQAGPSSAPCG